MFGYILIMILGILATVAMGAGAVWLFRRMVSTVPVSHDTQEQRKNTKNIKSASPGKQVARR